MTAAGLSTVSFDWRPALKDAGLVGFLVAALGFGIAGFRTVDVPGAIDIVLRFEDVAAAAAVAFLGRFALGAARAGHAWAVLVVALGFGGGLSAWPLIATGEAPNTLIFLDPTIESFVAVAGFVVAAVATVEIWRGRSAGTGAAELEDLGTRISRAAAVLGPVLIVAALVFPLLPFADRRLIDIAVLVTAYIMLGWGLNIVVGLAGLLDLGYVAFYAVGAYSYALLAQNLGLGFWLCLPFAGLMAALTGVILGFPVLRLRGDYLAIVTLGFGEIIRIVLLNWYEFTGGPVGIGDIPRPTFFGLAFTPDPPDGGHSFHSFFGLEFQPIDRVIFLYYLALGLALLTNAFTLRIRRLPVGRAWEALREDEIACRSLGINPRNTKLTAFGIGAMFGGFAGSFFATRQGFISPESFSFIESAVILAIVVLGGMGSQIGVVFAAVLLIGLPEVFRELQQYRMLAFGGAMVLIMLWRPAGLLAHREPTIRLGAPGGGGPAP